MQNPILLLLPCLFALHLPAQTGDAALADHVRAAAGSRTGWPFARVLYDTPPDGRLWACGATWKASFGRDGFTYLPRFGASAPSCPLQFRLAAVRVDGRPLVLGDASVPTREGDVVTFHRGPVREIYTLALDQVEQSFVVDATDPGDIEVELAVTTALTGRAHVPGLEFANQHGEVAYSEAFVRRGGDRLPISTTWNGETLLLRVAGSQRGVGPVEIDPILTTRNSTAALPMQSPDVAYDATRQRYLLVWEVSTSNNDHDIFSEQFDADGDPIAGSQAPVEITGLFASHPRASYLTAADAHLVAFDLVDPNFANRHMIYSRRVDGAAAVVGPYELLSNPNVPGDNKAPEIGADPGVDPATPHDWLVVWSNLESASDVNVHGRAVLANGQPKHSWVLVIEDGMNTINTGAHVSRSNGNGQVPHPMWLVTYTRRMSSFVEHVFGRTLDLGFVRGPELPIATSSQLNRKPKVSSPIVSGTGSAFLVTHQVGSVNQARGVLLTFDTGLVSSQVFDLTALFGITGDQLCVASDGVRFATVCKDQTTNDLKVRTLAVAGSLVLHDGPHSLGSGGAEPQIVALRDSGGQVGRYGIASLQSLPLGPLRLTRYAGQQGGSTIQVLNTACHGLVMQHAGNPALGDSMHFTLPNPGADFPGFAFGAAALNPIPICSQCSLGLRLDVPISLFMGISTFAVAIPPVTSLVGESFAVQGLGIAQWSCFGALRLSDAVAFTVR